VQSWFQLACCVAARVVCAVAIWGCAAGQPAVPPAPASGSASSGVAQAEALQPIPADTERIFSSDGGFSLALVAPARRGSGALFGHPEAEFGIEYPSAGIGLVVYVYPNSSVSIDDFVHGRRSNIDSDEGFRFVSERRYFLDSGRYRAASLATYASRDASIPFAYMLVAETPHSMVEVIGWTLDAEREALLREAVTSLRIEGES